MEPMKQRCNWWKTAGILLIVFLALWHGLEVKAGAAGKVFKIEANVGQAVKKGDAVVIIEAMKMEIPVVAPEDGTVASIDVAAGDSVEAGVVLATLN